jgi:hypothetical protein
VRPAALAAALALGAALGCTSREPGGAAGSDAGLGRRLHAGPVRSLAASADGAWIAFLDGCAEARAQVLPPGTASCDLRVVPSGGGEARRIARAVTTLPNGYGWHPGSELLAALAEYDYVQGTGQLVVAAGGGEAAPVADGVSFHGFVPGDERVAAVAGGRLVAARAGGPPEWMPGAEGITSFEINPAWKQLAPDAVSSLLRRPAQAGGVLLAVRRDGRMEPAGKGAGDYAFAPGGAAYAFTARAGDGYELRLAAAGRTAVLGRDVSTFAFSRGGEAIAWIGGVRPGAQGDLMLARVPQAGAARAASAGAPPAAALGREVGEFSWAARAPRLAWLERYDPRVRAGRAAAGGLDLPPRTFAGNVSEVAISADGRHLAWLQHTTRGGYSVDLALAALDGPKDAPPRRVAGGVFGFAFSPDARWLYYRTRCTRNAEACDLERIAVDGDAAAPPELVAAGVKSFEFDPRDPGRLLVGWQRMDLVALDLGVWRDGRLVAVDQAVLPGSARFLGPDSRRLVYAVASPARAGVYVAELPP